MENASTSTLWGAMAYALLCASLFYLGSRALITSWLWRRYPRWLAVFLDCSACSGFWYGAALAFVFRWPALAVRGDEWWAPIAIGLFSIAWTPMAVGLLQAGFERAGTTVEDRDG